MLMVESVTYSDVVLLAYLKHQCPNGTALELPHEAIATAIGMSVRTVRRATRRLANAGLINIERESGDSYTYRVNHDCA
jgi:predicted transcriptional regulator